MIPNKLADIWKAEAHYDDLRWSPDRPLSKLNSNALDDLKTDLSETIATLTKWLNRRLLPHNRRRIEKVKRKLIDFRWAVINQSQKEQHRQQHITRLENLIDPEPREMEHPTPDYGLRSPLKASTFNKGISRIFDPRPKRSVQS